jgi:tRNA (guanine-N7-)-methyltransferase
MAQKKLLRFNQLKDFPNTLDNPENMGGEWKSHFGNENPITLELACGRGEYTVALAEMYPNKNFIGVDLKGNRIYIGAKYALQNKLNNAGFLRVFIEQIDEFFAADEVEEIWITFPDPQLRTSKAKKRLTHPRFLRSYKKFLSPGGRINLKTDSPALYDFTKLVIERYGLQLHTDYNDAYKQTDMPELFIRTHYEGLDIAKSSKIFFLSFTLPEDIPNFDEELYAYLKETEPNEETTRRG